MSECSKCGTTAIVPRRIKDEQGRYFVPTQEWACGSMLIGEHFVQTDDCRVAELEAEIERLRAQLASRPDYHCAVEWRDKYRAAEAEIERLRAMHRHCDHCGGSWLDDGINGGCHCREIERLRAERDAAVDELKAIDAQRNIVVRTLTKHHERAAEAAGGDDD